MTQLTTDDLNLLALDRAIAQELDLPAGENIPRYTTDLNVAIRLMLSSWELERHNLHMEVLGNGWAVYPADIDNGTTAYDNNPALAICKARFPHLFKDKFQSS